MSKYSTLPVRMEKELREALQKAKHKEDRSEGWLVCRALKKDLKERGYLED